MQYFAFTDVAYVVLEVRFNTNRSAICSLFARTRTDEYSFRFIPQLVFHEISIHILYEIQKGWTLTGSFTNDSLLEDNMRRKPLYDLEPHCVL